MAIIGRRAGAATEEEPRSGSRYRRSEEEDERPRGRRRSYDDEESRSSSNGRGSRRGRSRDEADADEDRSSRRSRGRSDESDKPIAAELRSGWAAFKKVRENTSLWADRFQPPEEDSVLIVFLDSEPFHSCEFHFIRDLPQGMQKGYVCPGKKPTEGYPKGCPLCRKGDKAKAMAYFNVAVLVDGDNTEPEVKVWEVGPGYAEEIHRQEGKRSVDGDLTNVYFEVVIEKPKRGAPKLHMDIVRDEYLEKEWEIEPLTDDEFDELLKLRRGKGYVTLTPVRKMEEAAAELDDIGD